MQSSKATWAIFSVFFFESSVLGQWIPRIPDIKNTLGLSDGSLGLALLMMPLGTLVSFSIAGKLIEMTGLRNACRTFLPLWALLFLGPALATDFTQLAIALVFSGFAVGMIETAMNTEAARIEKVAGKRLMSRCHGFWSLGTMFGALLGGGVAQYGLSVSTHFLITMPVIAVCGYFAATALPVLSRRTNKAAILNEERSVGEGLQVSGDDGGGEVVAEGQSELFRLPSRAIVLLCMMPLGIMMVEGAFIDWSAVFMRDVLAAGPWVIAIAYSSFSLVMASVRLAGDRLATQFGDLRIVQVSGLASCVGIVLFALAPTVPWAFLAAALSGAGVAIVFPLAVSAAANRPGGRPADNVASLNMISFSAFLVAPPLIGFMSEVFGLRIALLCLAPVAFMTFVLAGEVVTKKEPDSRSEA
ncbi:MFS transporter [Granulosicoccus antarcticus]|uniref:Inner membrane protein YbjJ n=1 Tax=Granulosicoccus antarcticus IMCC3135 TaxID=1192854 RepID=A0A2Z2NYQ3_9GAMM|nr:MFS transporter [Granulosicoccus antarcticus]ASJ75061.1 Inner membrane protein YbjJ [Granulosicoccus antarcticus IMCC3135]